MHPIFNNKNMVNFRPLYQSINIRDLSWNCMNPLVWILWIFFDWFSTILSTQISTKSKIFQNHVLCKLASSTLCLTEYICIIYMQNIYTEYICIIYICLNKEEKNNRSLIKDMRIVGSP